MIVFDLKCGDGHVFEAWFGSSEAYEEQRQRRLIACPLCGADNVTKAVMAPNVAPTKRDAVGNPAAAKAMMAALAAAQTKALEGSRWVGRSFAAEARAMHQGDAPEAVIHGQATIAEAKALHEEGVPLTPLPFPVAPPKALN